MAVTKKEDSKGFPYYTITADADIAEIGDAMSALVGSFMIFAKPDAFTGTVTFKGRPVGSALTSSNAVALEYEDVTTGDAVDGTTAWDFAGATSTPKAVFLPRAAGMTVSAHITRSAGSIDLYVKPLGG